MVQENERLRHERLRQNEVLQSNNLARENERLRYERADRESTGAVGGLVIGLLVFSLAVLGIGAFYYLGRDTGAEEVTPTAQPQQPQDSPDINITAPQPPPQVNVQPPEVNVQQPAVNVQPPRVNVEAPTPPAIETPAPSAGGNTNAPAVDPQAGQGTAPETTTAPGTNP
ncbi:MAG TPA: hypothetical protein V6D29_24510 [Leptolyngbyaceae cyanobacterium]